MWLITVADLDGDIARGDAFYHHGMPFGTFDPSALKRELWGTISIRFMNCFTARLSYESNIDHDGVPYGSGEIGLVRLTLPSGQHPDCPTSLDPDYFGNYTATLGPEPDDAIGASYITIHRDGRLAYRAGSGVLGETGLGRITMIGEKMFYFAARYTYSEQSEVTAWTRFINGTRQGTGTLEDGRVVLDLGERGVLEGEFKSGFDTLVSMKELAGRYYIPFLMDTRLYYLVSDNGAMTSNWSPLWGCQLTGTLSIPDPGFNQLLLEGISSCGGTDPGSVRSILALGEYDLADGSLYFIGRSGDEIYQSRLLRD
jgi:hypothetical protein